jgi:hypothetical protein
MNSKYCPQMISYFLGRDICYCEKWQSIITIQRIKYSQTWRYKATWMLQHKKRVGKEILIKCREANKSQRESSQTFIRRVRKKQVICWRVNLTMSKKIFSQLV